MTRLLAGPIKCLLVAMAATAIIGCGQTKNRHGSHHPHGDHQFKDTKKWAKRWNDPARDKWQRPGEVVELLDIKSGMTVVDLGAGTGYFEPFLSQAVGANGKVLALDVSSSMVEFINNENPRTRDLANVEAKLVAFDDPQLPEASVDRVLIVNTWHHIGGRAAYGRKLGKSLSAGGAVVIVEYTLDAKHGPPANMRLSPQQVIAELNAAGFDADVVAESLGRQYVVVARLR